MSETWVVNKSTTGNVCRVQLSTASPIGVKHLGPFQTKEDARKAMCDDVDPDMQDTGKCWAVAPGDACED